MNSLKKLHQSDTSFERFAEQYDAEIGDTGDYNHQRTIDPPLFDLVGNPKELTIEHTL